MVPDLPGAWRSGQNWPLLDFCCTTPMAPKQLPSRSLARGSLRDGKNPFISCSHPPVPSYAQGRFPLLTGHDMPRLAVLRAGAPWHSLHRHCPYLLFLKVPYKMRADSFAPTMSHIWTVTSTCQQQSLAFLRLARPHKGCRASRCQGFITFAKRGLECSLRLRDGNSP